ncbi:hypothetical protein V2J09_016469 [Rumex salicifolius]
MSSALANGLAGAGGGVIALVLTYPLLTINTRQQTERVIKKGLTDQPNQLPSTSHASGGALVQILRVLKIEGWCGLYSGLKPSLLGTIASQSVYYYFYQVFKNKAESIAAVRKRKGLGDGHVSMISWLAVAAMAGSLNVLLTNPFWVLVTRMQTQAQTERKIIERKKADLIMEAAESRLIGSSTLQERLVELDSVQPSPYGTLKAAREVYDEAGIAGFWKGIIPTLIMVCNPSIQFMIYETSLRFFKEKHATIKQRQKIVTALEVFVLGAVAKFGATVTTYPLLVVKSRLQAKQDIGGTSSSRYSGTIDAIVKMIRYEGLFGFYRGMSTKIVQSVFAASVLFMVKEELVKVFASLTDKSRSVVFEAPK